MDLPSALWQDCEAMRSFALPRRFWTRARWVTLTIPIATSLLILLLADAQTAAKKVGVLGITPSVPANLEMFKQGLAQLGYTEGQQVAFVEKHADSEPARLAAVAAELVRSKPDVIFARGPAAVAAAVQATTTIPIVAVDLESDPIALGYAKTLARPGGNVTGVFLDLPELSAKQLQFFREIVPGLTRVALVGDTIGNAAQFRATERAARTLGVQARCSRVAPPRTSRPPWWPPSAMRPARWLSSRRRSSSTTALASRSWPGKSGCRPSRSSPSLRKPAAFSR